MVGIGCTRLRVRKLQNLNSIVMDSQSVSATLECDCDSDFRTRTRTRTRYRDPIADFPSPQRDAWRLVCPFPAYGRS